MEKMADIGTVNQTEIDCMKGLAEKFYARTEGAFRIGEAIEHVDAQENSEWLWFTGIVAENSVGRAMAMMNLITSGGNGGPCIGEMVLVDFSTAPPTTLSLSEHEAVMNSPTRSEHTTIGFIHTKDLVAEVQ
jgi:hypothetical protein